MPVRRVPGGSLRRLGELFVLTGFVIAQPLFDVFGKGADIFVFRQAGRGDILQLLLIILLLPTAVLWGVELLAGLLAPRLVRPLHTAFVGLLLGGAAVQLVKQ